MLEFFTNPMSRGQIVRWMLEEARAPYAERLVGYGPQMKGDAYLSVNPMGKVPAIRHDGRVVTECAAICAYLADAFPEASLAPVPAARHDYYRWLFFGAGPVEQAVTSRAMGWNPSEEQTRTVGFGSYDLVVNVLAEWMAGRPFVCGDRFTAADVYLGSQVVWGLEFETLPKLAELEDYAARLTARGAYARAKSRDAELIAQEQA